MFRIEKMESETTSLGTFKIVILGDGEVGKTTFVERHITSRFNNAYAPTLGVEVHPILFHTNYGSIKFNVWDCAGVEEYRGIRDGYYITANGAILMFDVTSEPSFTHLHRWALELMRVCEGIPTFICGNKVDLEERVVSVNVEIPNLGVNEFGTQMGYCDLSVESNHNIEKPFLFLARKLTGMEDLEFVDTPPSPTIDK